MTSTSPDKEEKRGLISRRVAQAQKKTTIGGIDPARRIRHEGIDPVPHVLDRPEAGALEGRPLQDAEQTFHLIEPGGVVGVKWKGTCGCRASQRSCFGLCVWKLSTITWSSLPGYAVTTRFMKSRNSTRRR